MVEAGGEGPATESDTQVGHVYFYLLGVMLLNIKKYRPNQSVIWGSLWRETWYKNVYVLAPVKVYSSRQF